MEDPQSTIALLVYGAAIIFAWLFARLERMFALRSQTSLERTFAHARPWGYRLITKLATKRRLTLASNFGYLTAGLVLVAVSFLTAARWASLGVFPRAVAYLFAGVASLLPLAAVHLLAPAMKAREEISPRMVKLLMPAMILWMVCCWLLIWPFDVLLAYLARQPEGREAREEALMALVEDDAEEGAIEAEKREMINSIMNIDEMSVREVMVPRVDIVAIERRHSLADLLALFAKTQHSRIPVYDERIDNIIGIVHAKDVLQALVTEGVHDLEKLTVDHIVREDSLLFVPMTKKIDELLHELRREKKHMAIVVDEYGGTAGLITMEDILEEIVGEIQDEYDQEEAPYRWLGEGTVEVDAGIDIAELNELIGGDLPEEDGYETLAGFLYHRFSAIPEPGEATEYGPFRFIVKSVDAQRIEKVLIEKLPEEASGRQAEEA